MYRNYTRKVNNKNLYCLINQVIKYANDRQIVII